MKWYLWLWLGVLLALGGIVACTPEEGIYTQTEEIRHGEWAQDDPLVFRFLITEAYTPYEICLITRHDNRFDYCHLPLAIELRNKWGYLKRDTIVLPLADEPMRWNARGVALQQTGFRLTPDVRFPVPAIYTLSLRYIAKDSCLKGIESMSFILREPHSQDL